MQPHRVTVERGMNSGTEAAAYASYCHSIAASVGVDVDISYRLLSGASSLFLGALALTRPGACVRKRGDGEPSGGLPTFVTIYGHVSRRKSGRRSLAFALATHTYSPPMHQYTNTHTDTCMRCLGEGFLHFCDKGRRLMPAKKYRCLGQNGFNDAMRLLFWS